jgi:HAD superfamily hydrolase (TIGR01549 family)
MITTVLMDYDSTIHDMDGVMERMLDGVLGYSGREIYKIWVYDIHRSLIHEKFLEKHDDIWFHCQLLFKHLNKPFDETIANSICEKFEQAKESAKIDPIYYLEAIQVLDQLKDLGLKICLSTGFGVEEKAATLEKKTGKKYFTYTFSEANIGYLKTEKEYYEIALNRCGSDPKYTVSVGDTPLSDIRPAKLLGIHTIWINRVGEPKPSSPDQVADYEVSDLLGAVKIIKHL